MVSELGLLPEAANTLRLCLVLCEGSRDPSVGRKGSAILWGLTGRGGISPWMGWFKPRRLTRGAHPRLWRPQHVFNNFHEGSSLSPAHLPETWEFARSCIFLGLCREVALSCHPWAQPPLAPVQQPAQKPPADPVSDFLPFPSKQRCPVPKGAVAACRDRSVVNWPPWCHYKLEVTCQPPREGRKDGVASGDGAPRGAAGSREPSGIQKYDVRLGKAGGKRFKLCRNKQAPHTHLRAGCHHLPRSLPNGHSVL